MAVASAIAATVAAVSAVASSVGAAGAAAGAAIASVSSTIVTASTVLGLSSMVVTGIGAALKNEDLMFAGKIMGYAALAGSVVGGVSGGLGAMSSGSGTFFQGVQKTFQGSMSQMSGMLNKASTVLSGGAKVAGAVQTGAGVGQTAANTAGQVAATGSTSGAGLSQQSLSAGMQAASGADDLAVGASQAAPGMSASGSGRFAASRPEALAPAPTAPASTIVQSPANQLTAPSQVYAPVTPTVGTGAGGGRLDFGLRPIETTYTPNPGLVQALGNTDAQGGSGWLSMPDWAKPTLMMGGGQAVAGLASGYFTGAAAEENAELEREKFRRGNYAPLVQFQ